MLDKIKCHEQGCLKIPSIIIDPNSPFIDIFCSVHKNKRYPIRYYLDLLQKGNELICSKCLRNLPLDNFVFFCTNCQLYFDSTCFYKNNCYKKQHRYIKKKLNSNNSYYDNTCPHNKSYTKYCKQCKISFCDECLRNNNNHRNHEIQEIKAKTTNELNLLEDILKKQEEIFNAERNIIMEYIKEIENKVKIKRIILQNYKNNKFNGNALNNLENLNLRIDQEYLRKLTSININNINNSDKALGLYYFNKMCGNKIEGDIHEVINKEKIIDKKNYSEDNKNKTNITLNQRGNLIKRIYEKRRIYSLLVLDSGNLAMGLSNGHIKIYKNDLLKGNNFPPLLTIERFKGRRINYIYQLKDKSLLCCTFSKIHHIKLKSSDTDYDYLGTNKLIPYEVPKKIIELGDNLIVSLGEKKIKKENETKTKCILKIFNKIYKNEQGDNGGYLSDNASVNSFDSASSGWESIYSSEDEQSSSEEKMIVNEENEDYEDEYIKVYKSNKNIGKLFLCTIFAINTIKDENGAYKFVATSNAMFKGGKNLLAFYGMIKYEERNGYLTYIEDKTIDKIACSQNVDSICFLDKNIIGVSLQISKEKDFDGIALIDVKEYSLIKIIQGMSIGIISMNLINNKKNIFFFTNKTKNVKKLDSFMIFEFYKGFREIKDDEKNEICSLNTGCRGCLELRDNSKIQNKNLYYIIYTFEDVYILEIKI